MRVATGLVLALGLSLVACVEQQEFAPCRFTACQYEQCSQAATEEGAGDIATVAYTCIVDHPHCLDGICMLWQGSGTFCTGPCVDDTDCPAGASCLPYLDGSYCVPPPELLPPAPTDYGACRL